MCSSTCAGLARSPSPATPAERLLDDYASYLVAERSLAPGTVRYHLRFACLFCFSVSKDGELDAARSIPAT